MQKDPFLELTEESTLTAANSAVFAKEYGTPSDDNAALSSLARISLTGDLSNEALAARIVEASPSLVEVNWLPYQVCFLCDTQSCLWSMIAPISFWFLPPSFVLTLLFCQVYLMCKELGMDANLMNRDLEKKII